MSRKLGAFALALGILVGAMGLKTIVTAKSAVAMASGVSPVPIPKPPSN